MPDNVHYVFLSATIPNAIDFARWICQLHMQVCGFRSVAGFYARVGLVGATPRSRWGNVCGMEL